MQQPWYKSALGRFRIIALCEGVSFLVLLGIAMPLKYAANMPQAVEVAGWVHGILFIGYMIAGLDLKTTNNWGAKKTILAVLAAVLPFGPFILEKKILQKEQELTGS